MNANDPRAPRVGKQVQAPVRIGVIGLGAFGRLHALTIAGLADAELVAVVGRRKESLTALRGEFPNVPGWLDLAQALKESDAEAWVVASSTATHVSITRCLLEAGKPVLLEKPISEDLASAESLLPLVRPDSSNLMMGHILLFNSEFRELVRQARQRGAIRHIAAVRHRPMGTLDLYPGEDPFHLTMVHDLYCAQVLVNREEPESISAQMGRRAGGRNDGIELALGQLIWPSGIVGSFTASFLTPEGMASDGFDRCEIFGDGWAACVKSNPRPLELYDQKARWPMALEIDADPVSPTGMMAEELRCFCRVVRGTEAVPMGATYQDALQVQRWLERLRAAADP